MNISLIIGTKRSTTTNREIALATGANGGVFFGNFNADYTEWTENEDETYLVGSNVRNLREYALD